jgi:hypothetical protein
MLNNILLIFIILSGCSNSEKELSENKSEKANDESSNIKKSQGDSILKQKINTIYIPENDYDNVSNSFIHSNKDVSHYNSFIKSFVFDDIDQQYHNESGKSPFMTKRCNDYVTDIIEYSEGIDGCITEK